MPKVVFCWVRISTPWRNAMSYVLNGRRHIDGVAETSFSTPLEKRNAKSIEWADASRWCCRDKLLDTLGETQCLKH
ncbi:hypothetical protein V6N11_034461 [Hibiscus sabdariffa]|uniref:Uncharacterized protein n=1 Tax=Hibiscus sabdariffa TaxID=183260 RepID=A0ABR1ZQ94_9ROSI